MLGLPKIGNLKFGGTEKGLPVQYSVFIPTLNYKDDENFIQYPGIKESSSFKVILPLGTKSIEISHMSFIKINGIKYLAKADEDNIVYAWPIQPNFVNPGFNFPVIKLGELKNFEESLEMRKRAFVQLQLLRDTTDPDTKMSFFFIEKENVSNPGVFHFKSESAFTFMELQDTIDITKGIFEEMEIKNPESFPFISTIEVHNKMFKTGKIDTVTYARIAPPTLEDIQEFGRTTGFGDETETLSVKFLQARSNAILKKVAQAKEEAIELKKPKDYAEWFTEKIAIELDKEEDFSDFIGSKISKSTENTLSEEDSSKAEALSKETNIPKAICERAILVLGDNAKDTITTHKTVPKILEAIKIAEDKAKKENAKEKGGD